MKIEHKEWHGGGIHAIRFVEDDGRIVLGMGMVLPGTYNFPPSKHGESIQLMSGQMEINGSRYKAGTPASTCHIQKGETVSIKADGSVTYRCTYSKNAGSTGDREWK